MKFITNLLSLIVLMLFFNKIYAQEIVKLNITSLVIKNINVDAEWEISKKASLNVGLNLLPGTNFTFSDGQSSLEGKIRGISIVPEVRFYLGKKGALSGFYVAPYGNLAYYKLPDGSSSSESFDDFFGSGSTFTNTSLTNVKTSMFGIGGMIGAQWMIADDRFVIDWGIGGAGVNIATISGVETTNGLSEDYKNRTWVPGFRGNVQFGIIL